MAAQTIESIAGSFQEVLERLGNISPSRIAAYPPPGAATEEDLLMPSGDRQDHIYELVDGVLVDKPMTTWESILAGVLGHLLRNHLDQNPIGTITGAAGLLRLMPGLVRAPDVAFLSWDRFPGRRRPSTAIFSIAPDLAVEIISEGNTTAEMDRKLHEYFNAGARLVWYLYPKTRTVRAYTSPTQFQDISEAETLDGGNVLPGFRLSVHEWFDRAWPEEAE